MSPKYSYKVRDENGNRITGDMNEEKSADVIKKLREEGYYITDIEKIEEKQKNTLNISIGKFFKRGIKAEDLALFSQQFSVMINAGIPLIDTLEVIAKQIDNIKLKKVCRSMIEEMEKGKSLSEAMEIHENVFPDFYIHLVEAGETGGILDEVLDKLTSYYKKLSEVNKEIRSTLYYPGVILMVALGSILFLLTVVIPNIVNIFISYNNVLPLPTRILLNTSNFLQNFWWLVVGIFLLVVLGLISFSRTGKGKRLLGQIVLKLPIIGPLVRKIAISRFASTLSILLSSGVNILSSLEVVEAVISNSVIKNCIIETRNKLREGTDISQPLEESGEFPPMVIQMIKIGEETGSLDRMLTRVAEFYDHEVETNIEGTISLIEPITIMILAIFIGFMAISIVMPLFEMYSMIN